MLAELQSWAPRCTTRVNLSVPAELAPAYFEQVLDARRSVRRSSPLGQDQLAHLLWQAARTRSTGQGRLGTNWQHRAAPSAGGIHAVELLVVSQGEICRYDPIRHELEVLAEVDDAQLANACDELSRIVPEARGSVLILAANRNQLSALYDNCDSLLWRDAGALMMTLHLVATSMNLAFCPMGLLGTSFLRALPADDLLVAAGTAIVGDP